MKTNNTLYLHIGEQASDFVQSRNNSEIRTTLNIGWKQLAEQFYTAFPPTYDDVDRAINFTEEVLAELEVKFRDESILQSDDPQVEVIAELAFNTTKTEAGETLVPQIELENVFDRFAEIVKGLPASQDVIPDDLGFAAYLLIIREVMHHLDFRELLVKASF
ncbi:hypothetical protein [Mangrovibacterium diazotrophicum]|uniref:Uncharacterized protein n=1 Tax=Mangrovibacterium diazotrophicum TaxID=1261403 RepID=A0A419W6H9_9BACT|nr:hypothetical protein [Mangrovibacterium diazotrophicum]RKD91056.1 hypothetical protein BC643_1405 [Mangrovibacterium diazotrophicum]